MAARSGRLGPRREAVPRWTEVRIARPPVPVAARMAGGEARGGARAGGAKDRAMESATSIAAHHRTLGASSRGAERGE